MFYNKVPKSPKHDLNHRKPELKETDIFMPGIHGKYAHRGREPRTNYALQHMEFKAHTSKEGSEAEGKVSMKNMQQLFLNKEVPKLSAFKTGRLIEARYKLKLAERERDLDRRKAALSKQLSEEEQSYIWETIHLTQEGDTMKFHKMKETVNRLIAERAVKTKEFIKEKRTIQYANRCVPLRLAKSKQVLITSKYCQVQQMRDNEARREAARELDRLWMDLTKRQNEAMLQREAQEAIFRNNKRQEMKEFLGKQIEGKKLMEYEKKHIANENYLEQIRQDKLMAAADQEALIKKREKTANLAKELSENIKIQQQCAAQRKNEERALEEAFSRQCQLEIEREQNKRQDKKSKERYETQIYNDYLQELSERRKEQEISLNATIKTFQDNENHKQEVRICADKIRKRKMAQECYDKCAEQIKAKKLEAEEHLKKQKEYNEVLRQLLDSNKRLSIESDRLKRMANDQYRSELTKQIEYNGILREREQAEIERQWKAGLEEEEKYKQTVDDLIKVQLTGQFSSEHTHPFTKILELYDCKC